MRALFEVRLYIEWILLNDSEKKADYYDVHNLRPKRRWAERVEGTTAVGQEFVAIMNSFGVTTTQETVDAAKKHFLRSTESSLKRTSKASILTSRSIDEGKMYVSCGTSLWGRETYET